MLFLFVMGLLRRDRLAVVTSLVVFFLYGSMLLGVLPREAHVSFEYHLAGAATGMLAAFLLYRLDPAPPRKRYSWEDEPEAEADLDEELELPRPPDVPALWDGPRSGSSEVGGANVIRFVRRSNDEMPPTRVH
jgi:hypothetical protein